MAGLVIGALFIAPYLLFSATSGQLADKYEKGALIRLVKLLEIGIMLLVSMLGGALLGNAVDRELGTRPIFLVVGFAGGTVVGTVGVARTVARALARFDALEASANAERLRRRIASEKERRER